MRLGIVGTGKIVRQALDALKDVPEIEVVSICSGPHNPSAALALASEHEIFNTYADYDRFLTDPWNPAEVVYVAVVNSAHYEYTRKALEAGKHVLLEKPAVATTAEWAELMKLAKGKGLYLTEAFTTWHSELFVRMKEALPSIGRIHLVQCNYSQYSTRYDAYLRGEVLPVFDPTLNGGCLNDINVYNLSFLAGLFGMPESMEYFPNRGFNGVDTSGIAILRYPDFLASAAGAKDSASPGFVLIQGEKGWIRGVGDPNRLEKLEIYTEGPLQELHPQPSRHRMIQEFRDMAEMLSTGNWEEMCRLLDYSKAVVHMLELGAGLKC